MLQKNVDVARKFDSKPGQTVKEGDVLFVIEPKN
jgi:multidrug efflux pump subunit AcrA (membrane-fusion protein)